MMFLENGGEYVATQQDMKNDTPRKFGAGTGRIYLTSTLLPGNFAGVMIITIKTGSI